jgi:O-6-methylguanine DNA methyltransferase
VKPKKTKSSEQGIFELIIPTPDGEFTARYSEAGLCSLRFPSGSKASKHARRTREMELPEHVRQWHILTEAALARSLSGRVPEWLPPVDLSAGSDFQQRVWRALLEIGWGRTKSYGVVAAAIGRPKAVRAVGGACGANPVPVLVPCHRVLAAKQKLGGFSGGLDWKRALLEREGIRTR